MAFWALIIRSVLALISILMGIHLARAAPIDIQLKCKEQNECLWKLFSIIANQSRLDWRHFNMACIARYQLQRSCLLACIQLWNWSDGFREIIKHKAHYDTQECLRQAVIYDCIIILQQIGLSFCCLFFIIKKRTLVEIRTEMLSRADLSLAWSISYALPIFTAPYRSRSESFWRLLLFIIIESHH
jgi:hypothetical protein